jgi:hypothetical protein
VVTWAVIATRDRHRELADLLEDLDQARAVVVDNGSDPPVRAGVAEVVRDNEQPPNLSRLWNLGLDAVARHVPPDTAYEVAVLNDDLRIPAGAAVNHLHPNGSTASSPELSAQAGLDRAAFVAKWGRPPW